MNVHAFNDGFIPLFITVNTVFPNGQDFIIVLTEGPDWWAPRYADIINVYTKHPIIFLKNETMTHCFPSAHIGLISHGFMAINQTLLPNSGIKPNVVLAKGSNPMIESKV